MPQSVWPRICPRNRITHNFKKQNKTQRLTNVTLFQRLLLCLEAPTRAGHKLNSVLAGVLWRVVLSRAFSCVHLLKTCWEGECHVSRCLCLWHCCVWHHEEEYQIIIIYFFCQCLFIYYCHCPRIQMVRSNLERLFMETIIDKDSI